MHSKFKVTDNIFQNAVFEQRHANQQFAGKDHLLLNVMIFD